MNTNLINQSQCLGLYDKNRIIGFIAVITQPHPIHKHLKRVHRLVILPDYQGIGLGTKLLSLTAVYWKNKGYDLSIVTSAKNLIYSLKKNSKWRMTGYEKSKPAKASAKIDGHRKLRTDAYTGRFMYKG